MNQQEHFVQNKCANNWVSKDIAKDKLGVLAPTFMY